MKRDKTAAAAQKLPRRRGLSLEKKNGLYGWFFIAPFVIGILLVYGEVVIDSFLFTLNSVQPGTDGYTLSFLGLNSYKYALFTHPTFVKDVLTSLGTLLLQAPVTVFFSLFIAVILNQKMHGRAFFRAMFFLPVVVATGVVAKADMTNAILENMESMAGVSMGGQMDTGGFSVQNIQVLLEGMYIDSTIVEYIVALVDNIYGIVSSCGVQIILFLAGLQGISPSIYEPAQIEGATGWETFWKITVPMISPIIFVNVIYSVVDMFTRADNTIMVLIDDMAFNKMNYSVSSAMAWLYFAALSVILGLVALLCYRFVFYQERD